MPHAPRWHEHTSGQLCRTPPKDTLVSSVILLEFCKIPVAPANDDIMHHVWFVSLVTRIRPRQDPPPQADPRIDIDWAKVPRWAAPMVIYNSFPLTDGPPRQTWPHPARKTGGTTG